MTFKNFIEFFKTSVYFGNCIFIFLSASDRLEYLEVGDGQYAYETVPGTKAIKGETLKTAGYELKGVDAKKSIPNDRALVPVKKGRIAGFWHGTKEGVSNAGRWAGSQVRRAGTRAKEMGSEGVMWAKANKGKAGLIAGTTVAAGEGGRRLYNSYGKKEEKAGQAGSSWSTSTKLGAGALAALAAAGLWVYVKNLFDKKEAEKHARMAKRRAVKKAEEGSAAA